MDERLYLNNHLVDIYPNTITRKIQVSDIEDISKIKSSFSYTFKLPFTSRNKQLFDMLATWGNISRKPYEVLSANYIVDNQNIILNGRAIIKESSGNYSVNLIDGFKSLEEVLSDKKVLDLPLSDLNHYISAQDYLDSFVNTEGFIYGLADFGTGTYPSLVKVESQAPSIYIHTLFRKIFESNGFALQGDFFSNNTDYLSEVLTAAKGYEIPDDTITVIDKGNAETDTLTQSLTRNEFFKYSETFEFSNIDLVGVSIIDGELVINTAGIYKFSFDVNYDLTNTEASFVVMVNGIERSYVSLAEGTSQQRDIFVIFDLEIGDAISAKIESSSKLFGGVYNINYTLQSDVNVETGSGGALITPELYFGELKQIDLVKDVISRFGLIVSPMAGTNQYKFETIEDILTDFRNAEDWSDKLKSIRKENYNTKYSQNNYAKYSYPENTTRNLDGNLEIDNSNISFEKTILNSPYEIPAASEGGAVGGYFVNLIPCWSLDGSTLVNEETPIKIMRIVRRNTSIIAQLYSGTSINYSGDVPYLSITDIDYQHYFDTYYLQFKKVIDDFKQINARINLSPNDIFNLNFHRLKYLKQTQRFYYLESVTDKTSKISQVVMYEVKNN